MANSRKIIESVTGDQTTAGSAEETLQLVVNGAAATDNIDVPAAVVYVISDITICGPMGVISRLQQDDGAGFFDIGLFNIPGAASVGPTTRFSPKTGWVINGGSTVRYRLRVETPGGAERVTVTIRAYRDVDLPFPGAN